MKKMYTLALLLILGLALFTACDAVINEPTDETTVYTSSGNDVAVVDESTENTAYVANNGEPLLLVHDTEALVGFIEIHGNTLYIAPVEVFLVYDGNDVDLFTDTFWRSVVFIERNDIQKMDEFGLNAEHDFPSGNHIRPNWRCAERAEIDFLSFEITEETEILVRGMRSVLDDALPNLYPSVIHFIEVHDGRVVRLVQEFKFTM